MLRGVFLEKPRGYCPAETVGRTRLGSIHEEHKLPNQDAWMGFDDPKFSFAGVFDGHGEGGERISELAAMVVSDRLKVLLGSDPQADLEKTLREAILAGSNAVDSLSVSVSAGCTASVVIVRGSECVVGTIGDSTVLVMTVKGHFTSALKPKYKTKNHRVDLPSERDRILSFGGKIFEAYVLDKEDQTKVRKSHVRCHDSKFLLQPDLACRRS